MDKKSALPENVRDIWTDAYKFHATFTAMGNTPEEWDRCAKTMGALCAKHHNHRLAALLLDATFDYLEAERKTAAYQETMEGAMRSG